MKLVIEEQVAWIILKFEQLGTKFYRGYPRKVPKLVPLKGSLTGSVILVTPGPCLLLVNIPSMVKRNILF